MSSRGKGPRGVDGRYLSLNGIIQPCSRCGLTDKYQDGHCAPCSRAAGLRYNERRRALGLVKRRTQPTDPCQKCGSTRRYPPRQRQDAPNAKTGACIDCALRYAERRRRARGQPPKRLADITCSRCGGERGRSAATGRVGKCLHCKRIRRLKHPGRYKSWRSLGWLSAAEMAHGLSVTRLAAKCDGCGSPKGRHYGGKFGADHSDLRLGGNGRFRGALCLFCNVALGYHERGGWPLTHWLAEYLARVIMRPLMESPQEELAL